MKNILLLTIFLATACKNRNFNSSETKQEPDAVPAEAPAAAPAEASAAACPVSKPLTRYKLQKQKYKVLNTVYMGSKFVYDPKVTVDKVGISNLLLKTFFASEAPSDNFRKNFGARS